jgi:hypothetical protein
MDKTDITIAQTILQQIGSRRFIVMTGASGFVGHKDGLAFRLPSRFATDGINYIRIYLNPMDTYDLEFGKIWGAKYTQINKIDGVYVDDLRRIISETTGLALSL